MGLLDFLNTKPRIPPFSVSVFGKLPCHREYFQVTLEAAFTPLKNALVAQVEELNRRGITKPLVVPDRRFFVRMQGFKVDLAGCIWESHDGQRTFPFMMAVPLPKKFRASPQPVFYGSLLALWAYLEAYFADLRIQPSDHEVYRRLRGIEHELPPISLPRLELDAKIRPSRYTSLLLPSGVDEDAFLFGLEFEEAPSLILMPARMGRSSETSTAIFGFTGLIDLSAEALHESTPTPPCEDEREETDPLLIKTVPVDDDPTLDEEDTEILPLDAIDLTNRAFDETDPDTDLYRQ